MCLAVTVCVSCLLADVSVNMPDYIDLSMFRGTGLQPGEEELPEEVAPAAEPGIRTTLLYMIYRGRNVLSLIKL